MAEKKEIFLPYRVIARAGQGEYEEKKSRFIARAVPAATRL